MHCISFLNGLTLLLICFSRRIAQVLAVCPAKSMAGPPRILRVSFDIELHRLLHIVFILDY